MADNTIAQAYVQILPTTEGIQSQLTEQLGGPADAAGREAGGSWTAGFSTALKSGGAVALAVGRAAVDASSAMLDSIAQTAAYGDNIDKMSQKLGLSAQAYQEWDAMLQHSGASIDSMQSAMKTLQVSAETEKDAFQALGLTQQEVAGMNPEQLFGATITALQNVESETERTYLATQLLGRGGTELGALLNTSAEDTEAMRHRVHELGGVMSDEAVKAAAAYQDSLQDMTTAYQGLSRELMQEFMPGITTVMDGLTEVFSGNSESGIAIISEGIDSIVAGMSEKLPMFIELGTSILMALIEAIIDNLPTLLGASGKIIGQLIAGIIQALPELVRQIPEIVLAIVQGLLDGGSEIAQAGEQLMTELGAVILNYAVKAVDWAGDLVSNFARSVMDHISTAVAPVTQMGDRIKDAFLSLTDRAKQWGRDLIQNFIDGLMAKFEALKSSVRGAAQTVRDFLGFSEPKEGPLSDFHTFPRDMMQLFGEGIEQNEDLVTSPIKRVFALRDLITSAPSQILRDNPQRSADQGSGRPIILQATIVNEMDGEQLSRKTYQIYLDESNRHGPSLITA